MAINGSITIRFFTSNNTTFSSNNMIVSSPLLHFPLRINFNNYNNQLFLKKYSNSSINKNNNNYTMIKKFNRYYTTGPKTNENNEPDDPKVMWKEMLNKPPERVVKLADEIVKLNMFETSMLAHLLQAKLGVSQEEIQAWLSPGPPQPGAAPAQAAAAPTPEAKQEEKPKPPVKEERTSFTLKLVKIDETAKFKILKEVRALKPTLNIAETKQLVDKLPSDLKENVSKEEGEKLIQKFKDVGAVAELH